MSAVPLSPRAPDGASLARIRALYDAWSPEFLAAAGSTFQSGLIKRSADSREDPDDSTCVCAEAAGLCDGERILDAGCGIGGPAAALLSAYPGCTLEGVTLSPVQVSLAGDLTAACGVRDRANFRVGDYHALPFADGSFDIVFFFECTGYSPAPVSMYAEAARVLRPGGRVYVKDVFRRASLLSDEEEARMVAFDALWACARSPSLEEAAAAATEAGLFATTRVYPHFGTARFLGSMFAASGEMNAFGRGFARSFAPIVFGEVIARKGP